MKYLVFFVGIGMFLFCSCNKDQDQGARVDLEKQETVVRKITGDFTRARQYND